MYIHTGIKHQRRSVDISKYMYQKSSWYDFDTCILTCRNCRFDVGAPGMTRPIVCLKSFVYQTESNASRALKPLSHLVCLPACINV